MHFCQAVHTCLGYPDVIGWWQSVKVGHHWAEITLYFSQFCFLAFNFGALCRAILDLNFTWWQSVRVFTPGCTLTCLGCNWVVAECKSKPPLGWTCLIFCSISCFTCLIFWCSLSCYTCPELHIVAECESIFPRVYVLASDVIGWWQSVRVSHLSPGAVYCYILFNLILALDLTWWRIFSGMYSILYSLGCTYLPQQIYIPYIFMLRCNWVGGRVWE